MTLKDDFRDGIMNVHTRQFGTVAELVIRILKNHINSGKIHFDLIDIDNKKIEVKASRVFKKNELKMDIHNFYEIIMNNSNRGRLLNQKDVTKKDFDCNIQQIKTKYFDRLIYLLFFKDIIEIFEITNESILKDKEINYSNKQHAGNVGEGQFHINNQTYKHHKEKYFIESITYEKLIEECKKQK